MPTPKVLKWILAWLREVKKKKKNCYISLKMVPQSCKTSLYNVSPNMVGHLFFPVEENQPTLETLSYSAINKKARESLEGANYSHRCWDKHWD